MDTNTQPIFFHMTLLTVEGILVQNLEILILENHHVIVGTSYQSKGPYNARY